MTNEELIIACTNPINKHTLIKISESLLIANFPLHELIKLSFNANHQIGFRISWILEYLALKNLMLIQPFLGAFLNQLPSVRNKSCMRHFGKICMLIFHKKSPPSIQNELNTINLTTTIETLFSWLIDDNVPVAVKANALEALAYLIPKNRWIKEDLVETMIFLRGKERIAFFGRTKRVEKYLL